MKNLFFVPFAFDKKKKTGVNLSGDVINVYLKNLCVSLISAKLTNSDTDVALVSNIEIPTPYKELLLEYGVLIYTEPFDSFVFEDDYPWCLAYYKLCALEKMVTKHNYDNYIYTDADVYVQKTLDKIILELRDHILLYDINHGLFGHNYVTLINEVKELGIDSYITHYGGEFFGASHDNAVLFVSECKTIFDEMKKRRFVTTKGDEFITSVAAYKLKNIVKNAGAYLYRFWTDSFYLVSTCYKYNEVVILHLPSEKERGMLKLYRHLVNKHSFPRKEKVHKICHLRHKPLKIRLWDIAQKYRKRG